MQGLELEESRLHGTVILRAFGHEKPWIGEITGPSDKYRYDRRFLGMRGIYKGGNCAVLQIGVATLTVPRLLEIQAQERGFFCLHVAPTLDNANLGRIELAPPDEIMLQELLAAREYAKAIIDINAREHLETQRAEYARQIADRMAFEELTKKQKAALKRAEARKTKLALILPTNPTRKINFEK